MFNRIKAKEKSKVLLRNRSLADVIGMGAIITVMGIPVFLLIPAVMGLIGLIVSSAFNSYLGAYAAVSGISTIVMLLIAGIIGGVIVLLFLAGMNRAALRMNRGDKNVRILDIMLAGDRLGRYIAIALLQYLFLILWNLPAAAVIIFTVLVILPAAVFDTAASVIAVILFIAAVVWSIGITPVKMCQYFFSFCAAEDNREMSAADCIRESGRLTEGHKWELFVTMLSFIGWDIIALLPLGCLFVLPYQFLTYTSVYEQLAGTFREADSSQMQWLNGNAVQDVRGGERTVEILAGEYAGAVLPVKAGEDITIGRDPQRANMVVTASAAVSGLHCRIRYDAQTGRYLVIDYSSNGTFLNNERLTREKAAYASVGAVVKLADGAVLLRLA